MTITTLTIPPPPEPRWLPPIRAGEIDGRYVNCGPDLSPFGDSFASIDVLSFGIVRVDGQPTTAADLQQAGTAWPNTLDSTGLIPTVGLTAPSGSAGVTYVVTLTADKTVQNRLFIRDLYIQVAPLLG